MADVTGPISTLPGSSHGVPDGMECDRHPGRPAVCRIQGETDSFGSEMNDLCEECKKSHLEYRKSPQAAEDRKGNCDWCKKQVTDLSNARDYDEGMYGPVYEVCGACITKRNKRIAEELAQYDDWYDEYDDA